jgi:hypothetical protein
VSVADGQRVNATVSNAAFVSKTTDSTMVGVLGLNKPAEGDAVTSVQKAINKSFEGVGATDETDATINVYANHNYITSGDDRKVAVGKLDAALNVVQNSTATFTGNKTFSNDVTITGVATVNDTTQSTSKDTGALIVDGGVGIEKDVFIGGKIEVTGNLKSDGTTASIATTNSASTINIGSGSGANTINIGGASSTVNITGTVNNQNVTNLNVTDKLITINDGGAAASGGAAGVEVEEDSVVTGYLKTSSDRNSWEIKAPNVAGVVSVSPESTNDEVVLKAKSQTLTNKTLTTPTINSGSLATPSTDIITLDGQGSTPSNPSAGFYKTYVKDSTGKLNILNSSGVETEIGGADAATLVTAASGDLAATTLNAALAELALEKQPRTFETQNLTGTSTTLTVNSSFYQQITGTPVNVTMPVTTTLTIGMSWLIINDSASSIAVKTSGGVTIYTVPLNGRALVICTLNSGTGASSWTYVYTMFPTSTDTLMNKTMTVLYNNIITAASGNLAATELNAALAELELEKKPRTYATTATAAGTTTLTASSKQQQFFTGTTTQTVVLPVASTMTLGFGFEIFNNSTGVVTVNSSGANLVQTMAAGSKLEVICILASGTDAASWQVVSMPLITNPLDLVTNQTANGTKTFTALVSTTTALDLQVGQIKFPATQNASADANTLDDYEEGTWTPTVSGTGVAGAATYTNQVGRYIKIGRLVFVYAYINITAHTGTGSLVGGGLPFASANVTAGYSTFSVGYSNNLTTPANTILTMYIDPNATTYQYVGMTVAGGTATSIAMDTLFNIIYSGCYLSES